MLMGIGCYKFEALNYLHIGINKTIICFLFGLTNILINRFHFLPPRIGKDFYDNH